MKNKLLPVIIVVSVLLGVGGMALYNRYVSSQSIRMELPTGQPSDTDVILPKTQSESRLPESTGRPVLTSLAITPENPSILKGTGIQLKAIAFDQNGNPFALLPAITWASDNPLVLSVDSTGAVRSLSTGTATITAKIGTISAATRVTAIKSLRLVPSGR